MEIVFLGKFGLAKSGFATAVIIKFAGIKSPGGIDVKILAIPSIALDTFKLTGLN